MRRECSAFIELALSLDSTLMSALRVYLPGDHPFDWFSAFSRTFANEFLVPRYDVTFVDPVGAHLATDDPLYDVGDRRIAMHSYSMAIERTDTGALSVLTMIDNPLDVFARQGFDPRSVCRVLTGQYLEPRLRQDIASHPALVEAWGGLEGSPLRPWLYRPSASELPSPSLRRPRRTRLYFRGSYWAARAVLPLIRAQATWSDTLDLDWWPMDARSSIPTDEYLRELTEQGLALSVAGFGDICHRDIECFALGVPVLRPMIQGEFAVPIEANVHYIAVPYQTLGAGHRYPDHPADTAALAQDILRMYRRVRGDVALLERVAANARAYYDANIAFPGIGERTLALLDLGPAFDPPRIVVRPSEPEPESESYQALLAPSAPLRARAPRIDELVLLVRLTREPPNGASVDDARDAVRGTFSWQRLMFLASYHGLLLPLASTVDQLGDAVEPVLRKQLQELRIAQSAEELTKYDRWRRLCVAFDNARIRAVTLKGFHAAFSIYGGLGQRQVGDLDFLVHPSQVEASVALLRSLGYHPTADWERALRNVGLTRVLRRTNEMSLASSDGLVVDLHWVAGPRDLSRPTDELLASALPIDGAGRGALGATRGDALAMLVTHGHKSVWSRLRWQLDVLKGLQQLTPDAAAVMRRHLVRVNALPALATALALLERIWGALPESVALFGPLPAADYAYVRHALERNARGWDSALVHDWRRPWRLLRDRMSVGIESRRAVLAAATPSHLDWAVLPLPAALDFGYYLVRPVRVLFEALSGGRRGAQRALAARDSVATASGS